MSIDDLGRSVTWREACLLFSQIVPDPASRTHAAIAGWDFPASRDWQIAAQALDDFRTVNSKKRIKPIARPWPAAGTNRFGKGRQRVADARALLRSMSGRG